jgi:hypothetical protein
LTRQLGLPLIPVVPVRLCPLPGPLYSVLMGYKESPTAEARLRFGAIVDALCTDFFQRHGRCLAAALGGPVDVVLPVPSSSRPGRAPLDRVPGLAGHVEQSLAPAASWRPSVLRRAGGPIGHMRPSAAAFEVPAPFRPAVKGRRLVLLDDTYVSGSRAQSAAAALRRAGARATLIVTLGRVVRPDRSTLHERFLRRCEAPVGTGDAGTGTAPARCCRCAQTGAPTE